MGSAMPALKAKWFLGIHIQPPDHAEVPPKRSSFSTTKTFRPAWAAVTALARAPAPEPMTKRSQCQSVSAMGSSLEGVEAVMVRVRKWVPNDWDGVRRPRGMAHHWRRRVERHTTRALWITPASSSWSSAPRDPPR